MKNLLVIALALITIQVSAQNRNQGERRGARMEQGQRIKDFTPEEIAQLQTKKMTLHLDLTESQQKQIEKLHLENAKERQSRMEERQTKMKEDRLSMMNERLDRQIEMKAKMKKILNPEQFEKWETMQTRKQKGMQKNMKEKRKKKS